MRIGVLGPVVAERDGEPLDLGARKQRRLLAVLAMHRGQSMSVGSIVEAMWEEPPPSHAVVLQGYVSGLRKVLEPTRAPRTEARTIVTTSTGYMLALGPDMLDVDRFEAAVRRAAQVFPTAPERPWEPLVDVDPQTLHDAADALDDALALWRGEPYADIQDATAVLGERARLEELRAQGCELREALRLYAGSAAEASGRLEALTAAHPHRESLWMLRAVALVRAGRQVDALASLRSWREQMLDELGLDPGAGVQALETAILQQQLVLPPTAAPAKRPPVPGPPSGGAPAGEGPAADEPGDGAPGDGAPAAGAPVGADPAPDAPALLKVGIVDDHPVFRMGMVGLLGSLDGFQVVVDADGPDSALAQVTDEVDVLLMDLDLGATSGIDLTRELLGRLGDLKVLVMTMHDEDRWISEALRVGASGYLVKSAEADEVERAIRTVAQGGFVVGRGAAAAVRDVIAGREAGGSGLGGSHLREAAAAEERG